MMSNKNIFKENLKCIFKNSLFFMLQCSVLFLFSLSYQSSFIHSVIRTSAEFIWYLTKKIKSKKFQNFNFSLLIFYAYFCNKTRTDEKERTQMQAKARGRQSSVNCSLLQKQIILTAKAGETTSKQTKQKF